MSLFWIGLAMAMAQVPTVSKAEFHGARVVCSTGYGPGCLVVAAWYDQNGDPAQARKTLEDACERKLLDACHQMGWSAYYGRYGYPKDEELGELLLLQNCHAGFQKSCEMQRAMGSLEKLPVLVATRDLVPGEGVAAGDVKAVERLPSSLPENVYLDAKHVVGRIVADATAEGELFRAERLSDPEQNRALDAVVPVGTRWAQVRVAAKTRVRPGSFVDLYRGTGADRCSVMQLAFTTGVLAEGLLGVIGPPDQLVQLYAHEPLTIEVRADDDVVYKEDIACP